MGRSRMDRILNVVTNDQGAQKCGQWVDFFYSFVKHYLRAYDGPGMILKFGYMRMTGFHTCSSTVDKMENR